MKLFYAIALMGLAASAAEYTFTGGGNDGGKWSNPANWGETGAAMTFAADDVLVFPNGITYAENDLPSVSVAKLVFDGNAAALALAGNSFTLGAGGIRHAGSASVTISNDFVVTAAETPLDLEGAGDNAIGALHLRGSVSGVGGLAKTGRGDLYLYKANPFEGRFTANGTGYTKAGKGPINNGFSGISTEVHIYDGGAMGAQEAIISETSPEHLGDCLHVHGTAGAVTTINIPVRLGGADNANPCLDVRDGDVTFAKPVSTWSRTRFHLRGANRVLRFADIANPFGGLAGSASGSGWFILSSDWGGNQHIYFDGSVSGSGTLYLIGSSSVHVHFAAPGNTWGVFNNQGLVHCEVENALAPRFSNWNLINNARLHLEGHNQLVTKVTQFVAGNPSYAIHSPLGQPAQVIFRSALLGDFPATLTYTAHFSGSAGLEWNPAVTAESSRTFILDGTVNDTSGDFTVKSGTFALANGAQLEYLNSISVLEDGFCQVPSGCRLGARTLTLDAGRTLELGEDVTVTVRKAVVDGVALADGEYKEASGYVAGAGTLKVDSTTLNVWKGGDGDWNDPTKWEGMMAPAEGEDVSLGAGGTITLTPDGTRYGKVSLGGSAEATTTLVLTGWDQPFVADSVRVAANGVLTHAGPVTDDSPTNRVYVVCDSFTVDAGGAVDASEKGWAGGVYNGHKAGYGLGAGKAYGIGGFHLGRGGRMTHAPDYFVVPYDDPMQPSLPGSGVYCGNSFAKSTCAGGGVVRIVTAGDVVVNGVIRADGADADRQASGFNPQTSGAAGGSVWITAGGTLSGAGSITADGGDGDDPRGPTVFTPIVPGHLDASDNAGRAGGGGGVALEYDTTRQTAEQVAGLTVSAAPGIYPNANTWQADFATADMNRLEAEPGTLHFADRKIVDATLGKSLTGRLVDTFLVEYTYAGDLVWTNGFVRFGGEGAAVKVTGGVLMSGAHSRFEVGGISNRLMGTTLFDVQAGLVPVTLEVAGDFVISNGAAFAIRAAKGRGADLWGGEVSVAGALEVLDGAHLYPYCDYISGLASRFSVGRFRVAEGAEVNATLRGASGAPNDGDFNNLFNRGILPYRISTSAGGYGPSASPQKGVYAYVSGSHGGKGARAYANGALRSGEDRAAFDDPYRPRLCGTGGGSGGYASGGDAGGVVYVEAAGAVEVDGTICADGGAPQSVSGVGPGYTSAGAGGTIFLSGATFRGGSTAILSAKGGDAWYMNNSVTSLAGTGAGGRIAVWSGQPWEEGLEYASARITKAQEPLGAIGGKEPNVFLGTVSAAAGAVTLSPRYRSNAPLAEIPEGVTAEDGTVWFCHLAAPRGTWMIFR
ncbi:MAG: hypothetical protein MJ240_06930 [Kiritimatiellae bacterium]|nr:hypothetical protein [Kiritimatiellia bacterium]